MFDPYHKWLGIPKEEQPPTYYRLLGLNPKEKDREVIEESAIRQTAHVRAYQLGPQAAECTRLLNEIAQARAALLDPVKRRVYDAALAERENNKPSVDEEAPSGTGRLVLAIVAGTLVVAVAVVLWIVFGNPGGSEKPPTVVELKKKPESEPQKKKGDETKPDVEPPKKKVEEKPHVEDKQPEAKQKEETKQPQKIEVKPQPMDSRLPVPDGKTLAARRAELVKYLAGLKPRLNAAEKAKLAQTYFKLAKETNDPQLRFAFLVETLDTAYQLADLEAARQTAALLSKTYSIESFVVRAEALDRAASSTGALTPLQIVEEADDALDEALAADQYDVAAKLATRALQVAEGAKTTTLSAAASGRLQTVHALREQFEKLQPALTASKEKADPAAHTEVGRFHCLGKGAWATGLKLLCEGSDAGLKALALQDLANPEDADKRLALGNSWLALAEKETGPARQHAARRAYHWYVEAAPHLTGLSILGLSKRVPNLQKLLAVPATLPIAWWKFDAGLRDQVGSLHARVHSSNPQLVEGKLRLGPKDVMKTGTLPFDIADRTIEAWIDLPVNNQKIAKLMSVERPEVWDGIIFSDFTPGRWTPGSSYRHRSKEFDMPAESAAPGQLLQLAAVYARDNSITLYRNGKILAGPFIPQGPMSQLQIYPKGEAWVEFGGGIQCDIVEARLYSRALTPDEIAASYAEKMPSAPITPKKKPDPIIVSKLPPPPDAEALAEAEKKIRSLFKAEYAKTALADKRALAT
ncbi:MAG: hypothetical protein L0215_12020, partial [Gemmataceae bacterium]|nr:hypothetical protein [Gemmataceae bacterium]